jgi:hypothetical protein
MIHNTTLQPRHYIDPRVTIAGKEKEKEEPGRSPQRPTSTAPTAAWENGGPSVMC